MFNAELVIGELEKNAISFHALLIGTDPVEPLFKPSPEKWCLLEIICHLHDEEREDFRERLQLVLTQATEKIRPVDPEGWVTSRKYIEEDYEQKITQFLNERAASIRWLRGLNQPIWDLYYEHPTLGKLTAKNFLCNWLAHDYLHIRQILNVKHAWLKSQTNEDLSYAGSW